MSVWQVLLFGLCLMAVVNGPLLLKICAAEIQHRVAMRRKRAELRAINARARELLAADDGEEG